MMRGISYPAHDVTATLVCPAERRSCINETRSHNKSVGQDKALVALRFFSFVLSS